MVGDRTTGLALRALGWRVQSEAPPGGWGANATRASASHVVPSEGSCGGHPLQARFEDLEQGVELFGEEVSHVADPDDLVFLLEDSGRDLPTEPRKLGDNGAG